MKPFQSKKYDFAKAQQFYEKNRPKKVTYVLEAPILSSAFDIKFLRDEMDKVLHEAAKSMFVPLKAEPEFGKSWNSWPSYSYSQQILKTPPQAFYDSWYGDTYKPRTEPPKPLRLPEPSPLTKLFLLAQKIIREYGLSAQPFTHEWSLEVRTFEVMVHEAMHSFLLSPLPGLMDSAKMGYAIRDMPGWLANEHELTALRCEAAVLARYDLGISVEWIWARANWRPPGQYPKWTSYDPERYRPPREKLLAPLTLAECAIVQRYDQLVKEHS